MKQIFNIDETDIGVRIDKYISDKLSDVSRSYIQSQIEENNILVNDKPIKSNYKLRECDIVSLEVLEPKALEITHENIPLNIIYEDSDVIVVNKPQGMVVHPAPNLYSGTLVNALLYHCKDLSGINGVARPGIVHRIDKDTSGVLVVAKNDKAHNALSEQLKDHSMTRKYIALVEGIVKKDNLTITTNLGRHPNDRIKMAVVKEGRHAVTHCNVLKRYENSKCTLVECILETGRTHQIRVHMSHIGHPLVGDPVYSHKKIRYKDNGQLLHAKVLGFIHPTSNEYMEFDANIPEYFQNVLNVLK